MNNKFTIRLKELIKSKNITQTEICHELHIPKQKLTNWKSGYNEPNLDDLIMLSNYFNETIDYLLGKE